MNIWDILEVFSMNEKVQTIYGAYEIPKEIWKLYALEEELFTMDASLCIIGLRPSTDDDSYSITPPDCIPFASTGGDGIHFGFLTDFGTVPSLNEAPIICVSPTNDPPIRYIADNLKDFFHLVTNLPYAEMLEWIALNPDESSIQGKMKEFWEDGSSEWKEKHEKVHQLFKNTFSDQPVNVSEYVKEAQKKRLQSIVIPTKDRLGIKEYGNPAQSVNYQFDFAPELDDHEIHRMKKQLEESSKIEKLAFIRDAFYSYVCTRDYEEKLFNLLMELMKSLHLQDEAMRLSMRI